MIRSLNILVAVLSLATVMGCHSQKNKNLLYIDENKPLLIPQIFAPGFISNENVYEFGSVFSEDGTEFYYAVDINGKAEIRYTELKNQRWSKPKTIISHDKYGYNDPFLSPKEDKLFYISNMPNNDADTIKDIDIWYSKKINGKWSEPINAGDKINTDKNEYYISFTSAGKMYFSSNKNSEVDRRGDFDIYSSQLISGQFQEPLRLDESINTRDYEADVFIAPDESYMIFCATRREGLGNGDLYISFKNPDGKWRNAKNMGPVINSKNHELCPFVTKDGKFLFYTSNEDIYWVSAEIIESLR